MKLLVISSYPNPSSPQRSIFVYYLVQGLVELGHDVTIISPKRVRLSNIFAKKRISEKAVLYQPYYLSFSAKKIGAFNTFRLTHKSCVFAIKRVIRKYKISYDLLYCHFWKAGFFASDALPHNVKPMIIAFGDSTNHYLSTLSLYSQNSLEKLLKMVSGFVSVSKENSELLQEYQVENRRILLAPNAPDKSLFYPRDKVKMREKHKFSKDVKIIIYVGSFKESKGYGRVLEAISDLESVFGIFLGRGQIRGDNGKILYKGEVGHKQLAEMLSCADVFVLPTKDEGSCNAIVEAMSCGLPIVSSKISAVEEQCNPSFSVLVSPTDVSEIRQAIKSVIYDDMRLKTMSENAVLHSREFDLNERNRKISNFLESFDRK